VSRAAIGRLAVVTCYRHPDYIRAITLRQGVADSGAVDEMVVVKNTRRGVLRYLDVAAQLVRLRVSGTPDAFLVTFRGYEILPLVLLLAGRRPVYYDEFINPVEWFVDEHHKFPPGSARARLLRTVFRSLMRRCAGVLSDTASHADFSAQRMGLPPERFSVVPVGSDEATFAPRPHGPGPVRAVDAAFTVLYYGSMLPLHGVDTVIAAAVSLRSDARVRFLFVGGGADTARLVAEARSRGAAVDHRAWVDYAALPELFSEVDLLLGGPFGGTVQSQFVITGKTMQYLSSARPAVVGENEETGVFTDRVDALVVPQRDPEALADAVRWAADHPEELERIGRRGRELYDRRWSSVRVAEALRALLLDGGPQVERP
jgi:glycosyltransferase involved in cell wall biosynthesis